MLFTCRCARLTSYQRRKQFCARHGSAAAHRRCGNSSWNLKHILSLRWGIHTPKEFPTGQDGSGARASRGKHSGSWRPASLRSGGDPHYCANSSWNQNHIADSGTKTQKNHRTAGKLAFQTPEMQVCRLVESLGSRHLIRNFHNWASFEPFMASKT